MEYREFLALTDEDVKLLATDMFSAKKSNLCQTKQKVG